ncbi:MAG: DUF421 domain-containing protein [Christensenellales bacterium]|jgi:uncharacterized membrane protein YcaP (DUF421 family)
MFIAFVRAIIVYLLVLLVMRIAGKTQVAQMGPADFVFVLLIADLAATPLAEQGIPMLNGIMPMLALLLMQLLFSLLALKSNRLRHMLEGTPSILIRNGKINETELYRLRYSVNDLMEQLRSAGYFHMNDVSIAILEKSGDISVYPHEKHRPLTPEDINMQPDEPGMSFTIITDGKIMAENLKLSGYESNWLEKTIKAHHCRSAKDILLLTVNEQGDVFLQPRLKSKGRKSA